jgi:hypothetical protein
MQKEFDDLMRSSATMKVSLTPDRLKTMEVKSLTRLVSYYFLNFGQKVYKQERDQRSNGRYPVPLSLNPEPLSVVPPRVSPRRSTHLPVESIKEDEEESVLKPSRGRQGSVSIPPKSFASSSRVRAVSTSGITPRILMKPSRAISPPVSLPLDAPNPGKLRNNHNVVKNQNHDQFPPLTRTVQRSRESIDLDDVMGVSDDENVAPPPPQVKQVKVVTSPGRPRPHAVSASTKELMDFLAEGPPDTGSRDVSDLFSEGSQTGEPGKSKGSRRLQKMISKLSIGGGDKSRGSNDELSRTKTPQNSARFHLDPKSSTTHLPPLANRPIPPRPPPPISPPSPSLDSFEEESNIGSRSRSASVGQKKQDMAETQRSERSPPLPSPPLPSPPPSHSERSELPLSSRQPSTSVRHSKHASEESLKLSTSLSMSAVVNGNISVIHSPVDGSQIRSSGLSSASPTKIHVRKSTPVYYASPTNPYLSYGDVQDMHHLLSSAASADECRLILDMFLAKSGIKVEPPDPSGSRSSAAAMQVTSAEASLEHSLVELLLGGAEESSGVHTQQTQVSAPRSSHEDKETTVGESSIAKSDPESERKPHDKRGVMIGSSHYR